MLAYRPKNRLSLDDCLNHKWVAKRPVLNPSQLVDVLKKKHQKVRRLRRNDTSKQMETSIKYKKRTSTEKKEFHGCSCSSCNGLNLPVVENFVQTMLTFFAQKSSLHEAYDAAVNVFRTAFKGYSHTRTNSGNPWDVTTIVRVSDGESEDQFRVSL